MRTLFGFIVGITTAAFVWFVATHATRQQLADGPTRVVSIVRGGVCR